MANWLCGNKEEGGSQGLAGRKGFLDVGTQEGNQFISGGRNGRTQRPKEKKAEERMLGVSSNRAGTSLVATLILRGPET